ncbi:hypothetical protein TNCV_5011741 [Trichonephila clavipes]|nr:hypothetical protein TNCV_5011741 [Trichonephila clavipes]
MCGRQVAGRNCPPTNKNTLIRALTEEWDKLPQQLLDNVVQSMRKEEFVANVGPTPFDNVGDQKRMVLLPEEVWEKGFQESRSPTFRIDSPRKGHARGPVLRVPTGSRRHKRAPDNHLERSMHVKYFETQWCGMVVRRGGAGSGVVLVT